MSDGRQKTRGKIVTLLPFVVEAKAEMFQEGGKSN